MKSFHIFFQQYLETTFGLLFQLLKDVSECESKVNLVFVMLFSKVQLLCKGHTSDDFKVSTIRGFL